MFKPSTLIVLIFGFILLVFSCQSKKNEKSSQVETAKSPTYEYAIVIHGGAGSMSKDRFTPEKEEEITKALNDALTIGENILKNGGDAIDAVEKTINFLENNPNFNAGKGAVFTANETNELDASIMVGKTQQAGAVGGVTTVKNPISVARMVMEQSKHVMMVGKGAEQFAKLKGAEIVDPKYFRLEKRLESLRRAKKNEYKDAKHGTVGCVALDKSGNIVAGTSTGGMTNKKYNRIGDSPVIGAGTFADERCGVSCTGHGEFFIRYTVAKDIAARVEYLGESIETSANTVVKQLEDIKGAGGVIALDKSGNIAMPFNTSGMYRGYARPGEKKVSIF